MIVSNEEQFGAGLPNSLKASREGAFGAHRAGMISRRGILRLGDQSDLFCSFVCSPKRDQARRGSAARRYKLLCRKSYGIFLKISATYGGKADITRRCLHVP